MLQADDEERWDEGLKSKERLFVLHFCTDDLTFLNATQSYKSVYKDRDPKTGKVTERTNEVCEAASSRLMAKSYIKAAVSRLLKLTQADLDEKNAYKLLKDLMLLADFNPADIITPDGKLAVKKLTDLGEKAKCIQSIEMGRYGPKVTLIDRTKAMQMYLRYLDLIRPEIVVEERLKVVQMTEKTNTIDEWNELAEKRE